MGNWHISIEGIGAHHNNVNATDANKMAKEFVLRLKDVGHTVTKASFTYGGAESIRVPDGA